MRQLINTSVTKKIDPKNRIAVIDDNDVILSLFRIFFKDLKCQVYYFNDYKKFFDYVQAENPELLIMDYFLNENKDCAEIYQNLTNNKDYDYPAVIISASFNDKKILEYSSISPYRKYLSKPIDFDLLSTYLKYFLIDKEHLKITNKIKKFLKN